MNHQNYSKMEVWGLRPGGLPTSAKGEQYEEYTFGEAES